VRWLRIIPLLFFFSIAAPAWAQEAGAQPAAPVVVHPIQLVGWPKSIDQFTNVPPDITLVPRGAGARHGQLWIRTVSSYPNVGLCIAGKVDGGQPFFPHARDLILSKNHIEIWLAGSRDVDLPEMGWNAQSEQVKLPKGAESCADWANNAVGEAGDLVKGCQEWAASQVRYRQYFQRLFVRQWLLAPDDQIESFATPAFAHIAGSYTRDQLDQFMKPQGNLHVSIFHEPSGYSFVVFIPFEAFPPLPKLDISDLYLLVDVFNAAPAGKKEGVYSTSSPARVWGKAGTFNALRLDPALSFLLTPCKFPLSETTQERFTWVLPKLDKGPYLSKTFIIENKRGCAGSWETGVLSPSVTLSPYFWMDARREIGVWVCGPNLTIAKEGKSEAYLDEVSDEGMEYKQMPDGHLLIKFGPSVGGLGGGCGAGQAVPVTDLRIYDLSKDLQLNGALALGDTIDGDTYQAEEFTLSPDWSQVTEYDLLGSTNQAAGTWESNTWCLKANGENGQGGYVYKNCGSKENVQPPRAQVLPQGSDSVIPSKPNQEAGEAGVAPYIVPPLLRIPPPPPRPRITRIRVAAEVEAAKLIFHPQPEYPPLAIMARIQGTVRLDAVIAQDGTVQDLRVISGHPLLVRAALEAVPRWRYQPTLLNGSPVEVSTEIDVNFTLPTPPPGDKVRDMDAEREQEERAEFTVRSGQPDAEMDWHRDLQPG
jgi:TonB family protein